VLLLEEFLPVIKYCSLDDGSCLEIMVHDAGNVRSLLDAG